MPDDDHTPTPGSQPRETQPGTLDMRAFERSLITDLALDPVLQWAVQWPDGRTMVFESEDTALTLAQSAPGCRILRRYVSPWVIEPPAA